MGVYKLCNVIKISVRDFINHTLISEIKSIQQNDHHYLSFSLISQGIEFLGACIDNKDWGVLDESRNRFKLAINDLFPSGYQPYNDDNSSYFLYRNLRCGLIHRMLPKSSLELIQKKDINKYGKHLEIKIIRNRKRLILVSEDLFEDFEKAARKVIRKIDNREIVHQKVYDTFLYV